MRAWRIYPQRATWAQAPDFDPLDGAGGLTSAGRWHHLGTHITYTSASPSLALLETLTHIVPHRFGERTTLELDVPNDTVEEVSHAVLVQLLRNAHTDDPEALTRRFGSAWAKEQRSPLLRVPSIVMPHEHNLLLNPLHPRAPEVRILAREIVTLEPRLASLLVERAGALPAS